MIVEIINVGTELLLGEIVNTNATYIQKMCKELGFDVYYQSTVGDNPTRVKQCLDIAFQRGANCVITTGGLGPTPDDLTKELSAEYLGLPLIELEEERQKVEDKCRFVTIGGEISNNNFKQALFPKDCYILENEVGTANGCIMSKEDKMIINLPGPPKELRYVIDEVLKPYLEQYQREIIYTHEYLTMGVGESRVATILESIIDKQEMVSIALYASEQTVRVRLGCKANSQEEADIKMATTKQEIEEALQEYIIWENNLKEALYDIMPAYHFTYLSDFSMRDTFALGKDYSQDKHSLDISFEIKPHRLGEVVIVTMTYQGKQESFEVPMLKKAELSYDKLEGRVIANVYSFLQD